MWFTRNRRRKRLFDQPLSTEWQACVERMLPYYRLMPAPDQRELGGHIQVFLDEKPFEGCGGLSITDEVRLTIASHACLFLLHREADYFPGLRSILVYPESFVVNDERELPEGAVSELEDVRAGEYWEYGVVILAWDEVLDSIRMPCDGYNVIVHEFAHHVDMSGSGALSPQLRTADAFDRWRRVMRDEYDALVRAASGGRETFLDPYGLEEPEEFFAVASESFFDRPRGLRARLPRLYEAMCVFYNQDPASWREAGEETSASG